MSQFTPEQTAEIEAIAQRIVDAALEKHSPECECDGFPGTNAFCPVHGDPVHGGDD